MYLSNVLSYKMVHFDFFFNFLAEKLVRLELGFTFLEKFESFSFVLWPLLV